jgi:hypothetical protein
MRRRSNVPIPGRPTWWLAWALTVACGACKEPPAKEQLFAVPGTPGLVRCDCAALLPLEARGELPHIADKPRSDRRCEYAPTGATGTVRTLIVAVGRAATDAPATLPTVDPQTHFGPPRSFRQAGLDGIVAVSTSNVGADLVAVTRAGALRIRTEEHLGDEAPPSPTVPAYLRTLALAAPMACRGD